MKTITILTIPGSLKNNQYLELLVHAVEGKIVGGVEFVSKPFTFRSLYGRIITLQPTIVHIHWETNIYGSKYWLYSVGKIATRFPLLFIARYCGVKFVWTMHNFYAHEYPFKRLDACGRTLMTGLANAVIIQNKQVAKEFAEAHPKLRVVYIPHGNYVHAYDGGTTEIENSALMRKKFRAEWQISEESIVLLALGAIRPYKRLELLIAQTLRAAEGTSEKKVVLIIAGKGESAYIRELQALAGDCEQIKIIAKFVPDEAMSAFFAAADFAVFAYGESSLTSGALLLALSFNTPVITLEMPAAEIITEGVNGYVRKDIQEMGNLFVQLSSMPKLNPNAPLASVADLTWERVGEETAALYASLYKSS